MRSQYVILFLIMFILASCFGCARKNMGIKVESDPSSQDTLENPPMPPSYAPGTAYVSAEFTEVIEHEHSYECTLKIITVYGVGSTTPSISKNKVIKTSVSKTLFKNIKRDPSNQIAVGVQTRMTLKSLQPRMSGSTGPEWKTIAVE